MSSTAFPCFQTFALGAGKISGKALEKLAENAWCKPEHGKTFSTEWSLFAAGGAAFCAPLAELL
jgi:hypothetical protein